MTFVAAEQVANAVLYEGYALYPYRAQSSKNRVRFQWGVLMPPAFVRQDPSERTVNRTQCLAEDVADGRVKVRIRFLHLEERILEISRRDGAWAPVESLDLGDKVLSPWDEAHEEHIDVEAEIADLVDEHLVRRFTVDGSETVEHMTSSRGEAARIVRRRRAVSGSVSVRAEQPGDKRLTRVTVEVENRTQDQDLPGRDQALRQALISCHTLLSLDSGSFVSLISPPEWAAPYVDECESDGTFPVLVGPEDGEHRMVLSSPIILYDHPSVAPESPGDLFDATEIDELLTLRTMTLTAEEKREARGTDPRTAAIIDQADHLPPELLGRLHGAIRDRRPSGSMSPRIGDGGHDEEPG